MQYDWHPYKKRGHTETQKECHDKMEADWSDSFTSPRTSSVTYNTRN